MVSYRATVRNGRLVLDEPTDLPDGRVVELHTSGEDVDNLDAESRAQLHRVLRRSLDEMRAGELIDVEDVIASMPE